MFIKRNTKQRLTKYYHSPQISTIGRHTLLLATHERNQWPTSNDCSFTVNTPLHLELLHNPLERGEKCLFVQKFSPKTLYFTQTGTLVGRRMSHIAFGNNAGNKHGMFTEKPSHFPKTLMRPRRQALITSRNKHDAYLMRAGHKCNKAAKVIRSATGHFTTAHTPHIGLWREI